MTPYQVAVLRRLPEREESERRFPPSSVIPAKAGISLKDAQRSPTEMSAFAGMTERKKAADARFLPPSG